MNRQELQELLNYLPADATGLRIGGDGCRLSFTTQQPGVIDLDIFQAVNSVYNSFAKGIREDMKGFRFIQRREPPNDKAS